MMEQNSQQLDKHYQSLIDIQHEQLIALRKENHHLRGKIMHDKQRKLNKKKEYEDKLQNLQNDARIRLDEGSELIRKLQKHLKICQEKVID
jgi:primosomal protein N''